MKTLKTPLGEITTYLNKEKVDYIFEKLPAMKSREIEITNRYLVKLCLPFNVKLPVYIKCGLNTDIKFDKGDYDLYTDEDTAFLELKKNGYFFCICSNDDMEISYKNGLLCCNSGYCYHTRKDITTVISNQKYLEYAFFIVAWAELNGENADIENAVEDACDTYIYRRNTLL